MHIKDLLSNLISVHLITKHHETRLHITTFLMSAKEIENNFDFFIYSSLLHFMAKMNLFARSVNAV